MSASSQPPRAPRVRRTFSLTEAEMETIRRVREEEALTTDSAALRRLIRDGNVLREIQRGTVNVPESRTPPTRSAPSPNEPI